MSVKLLDNDAFYGYRVRRTVNGKLYQEYFPLKKEGKRLSPRQRKPIEALAQLRDEELIELQNKVKKQLKAERCFKSDGAVKGISFLTKLEKSGTVTPVFQIGIASEIEKKILCTSISINAYGKEAAWKRAIDTYAKHKRISKNSALYKQLVLAVPNDA